MSRARRFKAPTCTHLVESALREADDFLTAPQLVARTGLKPNQVSAALCNAHKYRAVDFLEAERTLWWYATPASDTRIKHVAERAPETKPRKPRRGAKPKGGEK